MVCKELSPDDLRSTTWIPGCEYPLHTSFVRVITPDKITIVPLSTLMRDYFGQVSRSLKGGATEPEVFILLVCLLRADHTNSYTFGVHNESL